MNESDKDFFICDDYIIALFTPFLFQLFNTELLFLYTIFCFYCNLKIISFLVFIFFNYFRLLKENQDTAPEVQSFKVYSLKEKLESSDLNSGTLEFDP